MSLENIRDYMPLPDDFDEWVIPNGFQWIHDHHDIVSSLQRDTSSHVHNTTVLFLTIRVKIFWIHLQIPQLVLRQLKQLAIQELLLILLSYFQSWWTVKPWTWMIASSVMCLYWLFVDSEWKTMHTITKTQQSLTWQWHLSTVPPHTIKDDDFDAEGDEGSCQLLGKSKWVKGYHKSSAMNLFWLHKQLGSPLLFVRRNLPYSFVDTVLATWVLGCFPFKKI